MDALDRAIFDWAYSGIEQSKVARVTGSAVWDRVRSIYPELAPPTVPARLRRLVSSGLLAKDPENSGSRTKVYGPTDAGRRMRQQMKAI